MLENATRIKSHTKPAKGWRSVWRALNDKAPCPDCGSNAVPAGTVYLVCCGALAPSYEMAEEWARELIADDIAEFGVPDDEWLGAEPCGAE